MVPLADSAGGAPRCRVPITDTLLHRQQAFGYTLEDLKYILGPMGNNGEEAIGSMGTDTPLAVLSDRAQPLFNYFKQLFAQVTNPPLDAIREELVTSVFTGAGGEGNLLDPQPESCRQIALDTADPRQRRAGQAQAARRLARVQVGHAADALPGRRGGRGMERASRSLFEQAVRGDRGGGQPDHPLRPRRHRRDGADPVAAGLLAGCITTWSARACAPAPGWSIECGDAREVHHFALLLGYGAGTINPYVAFETLDDMIQQGLIKPRSTTTRPSTAIARRSRRASSR